LARGLRRAHREPAAARDAARDGRGARAFSRAPGDAADGHGLPAPEPSKADQAQAAARIPSRRARPQRDQHSARHADLARQGDRARRLDVSVVSVSDDDEIYLDYAASAPLDPAVLAVMERALRDAAANPASTHAPGRRAARIVETARAQVAARIGAAAPERIVFTSGATEANNLALKGVLEHALTANPGTRPQLVTSRIE